ncbi:Acetyl-CoA synthetase-like protein [Penicillium malachiteum]|uniref:Acetyl-CoA synthetase-like protein n=1 Tax=Penicillium malachiteum TaxID=1324776 RepID=A0AAD6HXM4_9EURO|nr:Acetyl-CoA synthetase-like protein [Penicillium malachiteum]
MPNFRPSEPIAVVGSGCRFPGGVNGASKLWELLVEPKDLLQEVPKERFDSENFYHPNGSHHGSSSTQSSYFLSEDITKFDARFFGIRASEADAMDPQQRLLLETVYESLEHAGISIGQLRGSNTAVYVGLMCGDYETLLLRDLDQIPQYHATGIARSLISNRISYFFDWHGPSMTIDTACSSSLVAVHQAVQVLRSGSSRVAVAAGSNLILGPENYISESNLNMLSPDGRSRMWDAKANGYARGEGIASVVLKTLSAALEDGDEIECIIRETGVNQDGQTNGITLPSAIAQVDLIRNTYERAGLDPLDPAGRCQFFEAHGTGTPAGDPLEAQAISTAFFPKAQSGDVQQELLVGSIKTVIGHTEGTAGLAGLLKASLAVQHGIVPANLLFDELSATVAPFYGNLRIPTQGTSWPTLAKNVPRRASVNSFGFGGTNSHAIIENYVPAAHSVQKADPRSVVTPFVFSGSSEASLMTLLDLYASFLQGNPTFNPQDLSWSLHARRTELPFKTAISARDTDSLQRALQEKIKASRANSEATVGVRTAGLSSDGRRILGVFTGQGAQWPGMGKHLINLSIFCRDFISTLEKSLNDLPDFERPSWSLVGEMLAPDETSRVREAFISQPLCTAVQLLLVELLRSAGVRFTAVVGHSSGEITAAYAAGFISATDAIRIAYFRGLHALNAQGANGEKGAMLAAGTSMEDAQELCDFPEFQGRIKVAACNSSSSITLSGDEETVKQVQVVLEDEQKFVRRLVVDKAYHSHHMESCSAAYLESIERCKITVHDQVDGSCSWYSSVYFGRRMQPRAELGTHYWVENMVRPVLFSQAIESAISATERFDVAVEVGPHPALKGPASQTLVESGLQIPYTGTLRRGQNDIEAMADALGQLWISVPEVTELQSYEIRLRGEITHRLVKGLPSYPWMHDRSYWHESRISRALRTRKRAEHELLGRQSVHGTTRQLQWRNILRAVDIPWISEHRLQGQSVFPAAGYIVLAIEAARTIAEGNPIQLIEVQDFIIRQALTFATDTTEVETLFSLVDVQRSERQIEASWEYHAAWGNDREDMVLLAQGRVTATLGESQGPILPQKPIDVPNLSSLDSDRFYSTMADIGYGYSGPFRALSSLRRCLGAARGHVANAQTKEFKGPYLVHPASLDAAFQSIILSFCLPDDGRLWSLHVPLRMKRLRIDPLLFTTQSPNNPQMEFASGLTDNEDSTIIGDVDLSFPGTEEVALQVEGLQCVPFSPVTPADDTPIFTTVEWVEADPNAEIVTFDGQPTEKELNIATISERLSLYYIRLWNEEIPVNHPARTEGPYKGMFNFGNTVLSRVRAGEHPYAKKEWLDDTQEVISKFSAKYPDSLDLQMIHATGQNFAAAIRGETTILNHLKRDNLLDRYYEEGLAFPTYTKYLARVVSQVAHAYPHLNILEIGAGTGGATKGILKQIAGNFDSYTFTDISSGFFDTAKERFTGHADKMVFKVLDIENDPTQQGYKAQTYDLVIASFVLHATVNLEKTMNNARRLLKPGGYLLLLEMTNNDPIRTGAIFGTLPGWWLGMDDGRVLSPCITAAEWDSLLWQTGFAGIDTLTPDLDPLPFPCSLIAAQAVDDRVSFLRQPLATPAALLPAGFPIPELVILGGQSTKASRLVGELRMLLRHYCDKVTWIKDVSKIDNNSISPSSVVLSLTDLDSPVFKSLTPEGFEGLKTLFGEAGRVLWITHNSRLEPWTNMLVGFGRTQLCENPRLTLQLIDFPTLNECSSQLLVENLLRFAVTSLWSETESNTDVFWPLEPELVFESGKKLVPRMVLDQRRNDRYNASRRRIHNMVDLRKQSVFIGKSGIDSSNVLREAHLPTIQGATEGVTVNVTHSTLRPFRINYTTYYIVLGSVSGTSRSVVGLATVNGSTSRVDEGLYIPCDIPTGNESTLLSALESQLIATSILSSQDPAENLVVHEPTPMLAAVLSRYATASGKSVVFTSRTHQEDPAIRFIHPLSSTREITERLPKDRSLLINLTEPSSVFPSIPHNYRHEDLRSVLQKGILLPNPLLSQVANVSDILSAAIKGFKDGAYTTEGLEVIPPADVPSRNPNHLAAVIDWTCSNTVPVNVDPIDTFIHFDTDKTYWLCGLSGSLGVSLCQWMIRHGAKYIVLSSRRPQISDEWLQSTKELGATVKVIPCDVTSRIDVEGVYNTIKNSLPPIAGVTQGAMVLEDTTTSEMSFEVFMKVVRPKVEGAINLQAVLSNVNLDFFVFFSSTTGVIGNFGQSNYTAANEFLASLAAQRQAAGLAASVINIGPVLGVGYVAREASQAVQDDLRRSGFMFVSERDFHQQFAEGVLSGRAGSGQCIEVTTGLRPVNAEATHKPTWFENPKFGHLVIRESSSTLATDGAKSELSVKGRLAKASGTEEARSIILESLVQKLETLLQLEVTESGGVQAVASLRTNEIGVDSLVAVEIRSWLLKNFQVNVPVLQILSGIAIGDIVNHTLQELPVELIPNMTNSSSAESTPGETSDGQSDSTPDSTPAPDTASERAESSSGASAITSPEPEPAATMIRKPQIVREEPLSFSQSMFWFVKKFILDPTTLNHTGVFHLSGDLRVHDLERAVSIVTQRHESLRCCFYTNSSQEIVQGIMETSVIGLEKKSINQVSDLWDEVESLKAHIYRLEDGETLRVLLLSNPFTGDKYLILGCHHISFDGVSQQVLMCDLEKAYNGQNLGPEPLQFPDYAKSQRQDQSSNKWVTQLAFWKQIFPESPPALPLLPLTEITTRPPIDNYDVHAVSVRLDLSLCKTIQSVCRKYSSTPFHFYMATFTALLHRYAGSDTICIGIADANRNDPGAMESIGPFLNLLPLIFHPSAQQKFYELLRETRSKAYLALANGSVPFEIVLQELGVPRGVTYSPLFQAFVDYRQGAREKQAFGNCQMELLRFEPGKAAYDISLDIIDNPGGDCLLTFYIRENLYSRHAAEVLTNSYVEILAVFASQPDATLNQPKLFKKVDIERAIEIGSGPVIPSNWSSTLAHRVWEVVGEYPEDLSMKDGNGTVLTYGDMGQRVMSIIAVLLGAGIHKGQLVSVYHEPTVDTMCCLLAVLHIGAVYVPLDRSMHTSRLAAMVSNLDLKAILVDEESIEDVSSFNTHDVLVIDTSQITSTNNTWFPIAASPDSVAAILHTSGSTGVPKGIMLMHRNLLNEVECSSQVYGFEREIVLLQSSLGFDMSLTQAFTAVAYGGTLVIAPRRYRGDAVALTQLILDEGISFTGATPSEYLSWLSHGDISCLRASKWKIALAGGEQITGSLLKRFSALNRPDLQLFNAYGPTEITCSSNKMHVSYSPRDIMELSGNRIAAGPPKPNSAVYILDDDLQPLPLGMSGQIAVSGAGVSAGYINDDNLTSEKFVVNPINSDGNSSSHMYLTGDVGRWREDGTLVVEGRIAGDTQIKLRGLRIDLQDVERAILDVSSGILTNAAVSLRRANDSEVDFLVAYVVFSNAFTDEKRHEYLSKLPSMLLLPQYMWPAAVIAMERLPMNSSMKMDRRHLSTLPLSASHCPQRPMSQGKLTATEQKLQQTWKKVIPRDISPRSISRDTDFFLVGGSSLLLLHLQARIRDDFGTTLPLIQLFQASTLRLMAAKMESNLTSKVREHIDWEHESDPNPDIQAQAPSAARSVTYPARVVVLTGATGYVGTGLLQALQNDISITTIYCIAVRGGKDRNLPRDSSKVVIFDGDLTEPNLGLSEADADNIFNTADAIIHNGADVSHLKSYRSLKPANFEATSKLIQLALGRHIPFHFVSTAGVTFFSQRAVFGEESVSSYLPPTDGLDGYTSSKWASERYLEKIHDRFGLPITIYRPSSISHEDATETLELMPNLLRLSRMLQAVPVSPQLRGSLNIVALDTVVDGIMNGVHFSPSTSEPQLKYTNLTGGSDIPFSELKEYIERETGVEAQVLPPCRMG